MDQCQDITGGLFEHVTPVAEMNRQTDGPEMEDQWTTVGSLRGRIELLETFIKNTPASRGQM